MFRELKVELTVTRENHPAISNVTAHQPSPIDGEGTLGTPSRCSGGVAGYRTGGHIIQPRRPVLRSRSRCPWPVVTYRLLWPASPKQQLVGPSTPTGMG